MNEDIAKDMLGLTKPVDINELLKQTKPEHVKVKIFTCNMQNDSGKDIIEQRVNEFLEGLEVDKVLDVKFNVNRQFLIGTMSGEYEEVWYAMIEYIE
jgi:hypothetical protein